MRMWLRTKRVEANLSQSEVARAAGLTQQYYSLIELGRCGTRLPVPTAQAIADVLDFKWERFYETEKPPA